MVAIEGAVGRRNPTLGGRGYAAAILCKIVAEGAVGHHCEDPDVVETSTVSRRRIAAERAASEDCADIVAVHRPARLRSGILVEHAVGQGRSAAILAVDRASAQGCRVVAERAIGHGQVGEADVDPSALHRAVILEFAVAYGWAAERIDARQPATVHAGISSL